MIANRPLVPFAAAASLLIICHQIAGKATRDALYLSQFPVTSLPYMVLGAAVISILIVLGVSKALSRWGPAKLVPGTFAGSAALHAAEWMFIGPAPQAVAILFYLHMAGLGAVMISGFWSLVNEALDPRSAKHNIGRIAGAGTVGGLVGGLVAERVAAWFSVPAMLPLLSGLHGASALLLLLLPSPARRAMPVDTQKPSGLAVIGRTGYLKELAALVLIGTTCAALLDYIFKVQATAAYGKGAPLLRFFAVFYAAVGIGTFLMQAGLSRRVLEKFGLGRTVATLPASVAAGGAVALILPGLAAAAIARAGELILRSSLFRSGYEVFYTPVPGPEKRAAKPIVDVGFDRLGDAVGSTIVRFALLLPAAFETQVLLAAAIALGAAGAWIAARLDRGYVAALERSLVDRAVDLELDDVRDSTTRLTLISAPRLKAITRPFVVEPPPPPPTTTPPRDPLIERLSSLRSGNLAAARKALAAGPLNAALLPHVIPLLAWDELAPDVVQALRPIAGSFTGQLIDALLDPEQDFAVRRRLPRVLSSSQTQRAADGLFAGLADKRFEVRFQCGRALGSMHRREPQPRFDSAQVFAAAMREIESGAHLWQTQRLLDAADDPETSFFVDEVLRDRASRGLEHVFTVLSLTLPDEPLRIAFRGLYTEDRALRGTALEYLESVLPPDLREKLWPFLEAPAAKPDGDRPSEQILAELIRSNQSIQIRLEELRGRQSTSRTSPGSAPPS